MAFESAKITTQNRRLATPFVKFTWNQNMFPRGYVGGTFDAHGHCGLLIEVDYETKQLRMKGAPRGEGVFSLGSSKQRNFAFSKHVMNRLDIDTTKRIPLTLKEDGWYYGTYEQ